LILILLGFWIDRIEKIGEARNVLIDASTDNPNGITPLVVFVVYNLPNRF
jgi:hypothetical protein